MTTRLIAFDLDGTLLGSDGRISERTKNTLELAAQRGIHLAIASGRPFTALPEELFHLPWLRYAITSNGSSIFTMADGRRIFSRDMRPETAAAVLDIAEEAAFPWEIFIDGTGYAPAPYVRKASDFGAPARANAYVSRTRVPVDDMSAFARNSLAKIEGINMIVPDPVRKAALQQELAGIPQLYITSSVSHYIEMADGSVSKSAALKALAERLGLTMQQTVAFGDSLNDLDLIRSAGTGIAMANALPQLLEAADDHALSNDADGVADYIEKHFIKELL